MSRDNNLVTEYRKKSKALGSTYGLSAIMALLHALGDPQDQIPVIHVAGTNGKGSICNFLSKAFTHSGLKCGVYTSPAVFYDCERYTIDGQPITEAAFAKIQEHVIGIAAEKNILVSLFELETAIAYTYFCEAHCDIAIMEAGCGGRYDATNVTRHPLAVCFSSIGYDHMDLLGETLSEIAANKAGLIKEGALIVSAPQDTEVADALDRAARERHNVIYYANRGIVDPHSDHAFCYKGCDYVLQTPGRYQIENAITAITLLDALRSQKDYKVSDADIKSGIEETIMPGRFEEIRENIYIDGAHNLPAILALKDTLDAYFTNKSFTFIIGVLKDKAYPDYLPRIVDMADSIYTIATLGARGLDAAALADAIRAFHPDSVTSLDDIEQAAGIARRDALAGKIVVFFGSLSRLNDFKCACAKEQ